MKAFVGLILAAAGLAILTVSDRTDRRHCAIVEVAAPGGRTSIVVRVADDPFERARGLRHTFRMDVDGMLFVYPSPRRVEFTMRSVSIPLDIAFVRSNGRVIEVVRDRKADDLRTIPSPDLVAAVLEIPTGTSDRLGAIPGALVRLGARAPCPTAKAVRPFALTGRDGVSRLPSPVS